MRSPAAAVLVPLLLAAVAASAGCFETKYPLSEQPAGAKIDPRYLGEWSLEQLDADGQVAASRLVVRNLHGESYFVDWRGGGTDEEPLRATAYLTDVNGVTFANARLLSDTPEPSNTYVILRVDLDGEKLKLRNLDGDFFKDKKFDSPDALRKIVADNLENEKMYKGEPWYGARRGN
jgi:hypothetical protein